MTLNPSAVCHSCSSDSRQRRALPEDVCVENSQRLNELHDAGRTLGRGDDKDAKRIRRGFDMLRGITA